MLTEAKRGGSRRRSSRGSKGSLYKGDEIQASETSFKISTALENDAEIKRVAALQKLAADRALRASGKATEDDVRYDANLDMRRQRRQPTITNLRGKV